MQKPENILILHCDQLRWDCLGYAGNPDVRTPNLDALAADSVQHTRHYTVYPICTPSRYSLWSGMYVHQHGAWNNRATLPSGYATLPRLLMENGFDTAAVGKMHFTPTYHDIGFTRMRLAEQNGVGRYSDDYHAELMQAGYIDRVDLHHQSGMFSAPPSNPRFDMFQSRESDLPKALHTTTWTTNGALAEISSWDSAPHMLMVGYIKPHHPFDPPHPYSKMYDPAALSLPAGYTSLPFAHDTETNGTNIDYAKMSEDDLRQVMAHYYGSITQIDDGIGEIIALLKDKGLYERTLIIFTSDHGEYLGYHHMLLKCNHLYEPLARIPLLMKYPGGKPAVDEGLSENIDIMPTILEACGIDIPASVHGKSLLAGESRDYAFAEGQFGSDSSPCNGYMVCGARYKLLIRGTLDSGMLFDLEEDPHELHNLFFDPAYTGVLAMLKSCLVDKMLFSGTGKNHCDIHAPQVIPSSTQAERATKLQAFIREQW